MPLPDNLDQVNNAGGWTAGALAALGTLRFAWLRLSKDRVTLAADDVQLTAIRSLQERVAQLDGRLDKEEKRNNRLISFMVRAMGILARCDCDHAEEYRDALQKEFDAIMQDVEKGA